MPCPSFVTRSYQTLKVHAVIRFSSTDTLFQIAPVGLNHSLVLIQATAAQLTLSIVLE